MQNIHKKFRSVLNIFQVVEGVVADPPWHDVGAQNALVTRGLILVGPNNLHTHNLWIAPNGCHGNVWQSTNLNVLAHTI